MPDRPTPSMPNAPAVLRSPQPRSNTAGSPLCRRASRYASTSVLLAGQSTTPSLAAGPADRRGSAEVELMAGRPPVRWDPPSLAAESGVDGCRQPSATPTLDQ